MTQQGIYWLCEEPTEEHRRKAQLLADIDYDISFFADLASLETGISTKRVPVIIISTGEDLERTSQSIHALAANPAIQGARLILTYEDKFDTALSLAAGHGFRDILRMDWDDHTWLERFEFSTSGQGQEELQIDQLSSASCAHIDTFIPARLVWLNRQRGAKRSNSTKLI